MNCLDDLNQSLQDIAAAIESLGVGFDFVQFTPELRRGGNVASVSTQYAFSRAVLTGDGTKYAVDAFGRVALQGTSGGTGNWLLTGLPHNIDLGGSATTLVGDAIIYDQSAGLYYFCAAVAIGSNNVQFQVSGLASRFGSNPSTDYGASDEVAFNLRYKAAVL